ncbi:MAG TPA: OmpH family outer membrane protein [Rhizomicrobium sp.]|nr:OmpH family outer membrane protein [Rhizomicrobium sp.]
MKISTFASRSALTATGLALAMVLLAVPPALAQGKPASAPQGAPVPRILVIDRQALLRQSKVGQSIAQQVQAMTKAAESELKGENESLRREGATLQQQVAILAPDVKAQKIKAFEAKQAAFQQKVQLRQNQIRYGVAMAQRQVEAVAGPIVQKIMTERGANLMIDRQAIVIGAPGLDVTPQAIQLLDQKLPSVKVQLATPPVDLLQRMQPQQQ